MKYLSLLLLLTLVSCYIDVKNIEIKGQILDSQLKRPVSHSSITIICWSYGNTPDGSYTKQDSLNVTSDSDGNYRGDFEKGAYIEIKTSAKDYLDNHQAFDVTTSKNHINIYMEKKNRRPDIPIARICNPMARIYFIRSAKASGVIRANKERANYNPKKL